MNWVWRQGHPYMFLCWGVASVCTCAHAYACVRVLVSVCFVLFVVQVEDWSNIHGQNSGLLFLFRSGLLWFLWSWICVAQAGLEFIAVFLPQPSEVWDYRNAPPCLATFSLLISPGLATDHIITLYFHIGIWILWTVGKEQENSRSPNLILQGQALRFPFISRRRNSKQPSEATSFSLCVLGPSLEGNVSCSRDKPGLPVNTVHYSACLLDVPW